MLTQCREEIEGCVSKIDGALREERAAASALDNARVGADELDAHMRLMQAQVEAAVLASTNPTNTSVPSLVLSIELQTLVERTRVVEESLRVAQAALKEAHTAHYWYVGADTVLKQSFP